MSESTTSRFRTHGSEFDLESGPASAASFHSHLAWVVLLRLLECRGTSLGGARDSAKQQLLSLWRTRWALGSAELLAGSELGSMVQSVEPCCILAGAGSSSASERYSYPGSDSDSDSAYTHCSGQVVAAADMADTCIGEAP